MEKVEFEKENKYLQSTLDLINSKLKSLESFNEKIDNMLDDSNKEYFEYLNNNANKFNDDDFIEITNLQGRLNELENETIESIADEKTYNKMLDKPYFASINLKESGQVSPDKYYIGLHSLLDDNKHFWVIDWRSPIASIFYDVEEGKCVLRTNSSITNCELLSKRQYGIEKGKLNYYIDSNVNIEDDLLKEALAKNASNQMKSIVQTIQKEQNIVIRGDEYKNMVVQGVAGSGKTAIALHRIAYILYKQKNKIASENINFISPNNAFSSYISTVLPDLAEDDITKVQLDDLARVYLKKHLIMEKKFEQIERLISTQDLKEYNYKTSYQFVLDMMDFANKNYIDNFEIEDFDVRGVVISSEKIKELFFGKYKDRDLFTRLRWITDNIFDLYFYNITSVDKANKFKQFIFMKLYDAIKHKNCVRAYMNFLQSKGMTLNTIDGIVKNEDAYGVLFFKIFIYGVDKFEKIKYLVIDEMQDYSAMQLYFVNKIYDCPMTLLGDYNQTICPKNSHELINNYSNIIGENNYIELNKTYRSTEQIVNFYNAVGLKSNVNYVSRSGDNVQFLSLDTKNQVSKLLEYMEKLKQKGYKSIAIITKTNNDALKLSNAFRASGVDIGVIDDNSDSYENDCIISIYNSKGLEFDAVIIYNVSDNYSTDLDRNLLYIASTRALHSLTITTTNNFSPLIKDLIN